MSHRIKLITLDLDDTLWPAKTVLLKAEHIYYQQLQELAPGLTDHVSAQALREYRLNFLQTRPELQDNISHWRLESTTALLEQHGYGKRAAHISKKAFDIFWQARQQVTLFQGVSDSLKMLSQRYILISLTNGNAHLDKMPLSKYVTHSLRAEQFGASKPKPVLFERALILASSRPEETLHIGDHPKDDIEGATQLGIRTIQAQLLEKNRDAHPLANGWLKNWRDAKHLIASLDNAEAP